MPNRMAKGEVVPSSVTGMLKRIITATNDTDQNPELELVECLRGESEDGARDQRDEANAEPCPKQNSEERAKFRAIGPPRRHR